MTQGLQSDVYMQTTHCFKDKKAKVSFSGTIKKILIGSLIASAITSAVTPTAFAASLQDTSNKTTTLENSTVTQNYEADEESRIFSINAVLDKIEAGVISKESIKLLAKQLIELDKEVLMSGKTASSDVVAVVQRADNLIAGVTAEDTTEVKAALTLIKTDLGISDTVKNTEGTMESTPRLAATTTSPKTFTDVKKGAWYYDNVMKLVAKGAIAGYKDKNGKDIFAPNANITNAEYLTILMKAVQGGTYNKVSPNAHWASGVIVAAYKAGVVTPTEITANDYNKAITRKSMALYTERALELIKNEKKLDTTNIENIIHDFSKVDGSKYEDAVKQIYARGIVGGDVNFNFNPDSNATRAESATILLKTIEKSSRKDMSKVDISIPVWESKADSTMIIQSGIYKGRITPEAGEKFDFNALKSALFYKDVNGQCYVSINLPKLPQGFKWGGALIVYDKDGGLIFSTKSCIEEKTGAIKIKVTGVTASTISKVESATLTLKVVNKDNEYMISHSLSTNVPDKVLSQDANSSSEREWIELSTKDIFKW